MKDSANATADLYLAEVRNLHKLNVGTEHSYQGHLQEMYAGTRPSTRGYIIRCRLTVNGLNLLLVSAASICNSGQ